MGSRLKSSINAKLFGALLAACAIGCGGPKLYPVTGTVTLDGKPLVGAAVAFAPETGGPTGNGVTDATGKYLVHTVNDAGVLAGKYRVGVAIQQVGSWLGDPEGTSGSPRPGTAPIKYLTPEKYSSPDTSGFVAEVAPDRLEFDFALTTKDTAR